MLYKLEPFSVQEDETGRQTDSLAPTPTYTLTKKKRALET